MAFSFDNSLGILIANVRNGFKSALEKELLNHTKEIVSSTQRLVILRLCEKDGLTQKELAKDTNFKPSSLTLMLDKLEKNALVERRAKENDRRAYLIYVTQKGRELQELLIDVGTKIEKESLEGVSKEEQEILNKALKKIYSNIKQRAQ